MTLCLHTYGAYGACILATGHDGSHRDAFGYAIPDRPAPCFVHHPASLDGARSWVASLPGPITAGAALTALRGEGSHCCVAGAQAAYLIGAAAREMATETELAREGQHAYTFEMWTPAGGIYRLTGDSPLVWASKPARARERALAALGTDDYRLGAGYHARGYCCPEITAEPGESTRFINEIGQDARDYPGHRATLLRMVIRNQDGRPARYPHARYVVMAAARYATREV